MALDTDALDIDDTDRGLPRAWTAENRGRRRPATAHQRRAVLDRLARELGWPREPADDGQPAS